MKFSTTAILFATFNTATAFVTPTARAGISARRFVLSEPSKVEAEVEIADTVDIEDKKEESPVYEAAKIEVDVREVTPNPVSAQAASPIADGSLQPYVNKFWNFSISFLASHMF